MAMDFGRSNANAHGLVGENKDRQLIRIVSCAILAHCCYFNLIGLSRGRRANAV
ncbi:hypothetical protein GQ53DRAFT_33140 [Thozetella sp. PMI_491]|nr:hypothetical protein GQ53DRAFT_33140 [Thozetella sp. PMI_491]